MTKKMYHPILLITLMAIVLALVAWSMLAHPIRGLARAVNLEPLQNITQVAAGGGHTCGLTTGGGVKCWGANYSGQLGDGTTINHSTPVGVGGLDSNIKTIAAGGSHTCALTSGGGVKCWGSNYSGQLGDGTTINKNTPVDVSGLSSGVVAIVAGYGRSCALTTGGGVKCWGNNSSGQLGDGTTINKNTPVGVTGLSSGIAAIAIGDSHTCALTTGGGVKCWGENYEGQLGDGTTSSKNTPVDVSGLGSSVAAIVAGTYHTCALTKGGGVKCWGWNYHGELGDGTTTNKNIPIDVSDLSNGVTTITAGNEHTCALTTSGGVMCWGYNSHGQLGDGSTSNKSTPVAVSSLSSGVISIAAGGHHTCVLTANGHVKCWGSNNSGQLGDSTIGNNDTPVEVSGLSNGIKAITAGTYHTCALTTNGGVKCWGFNDYGQLGDSTIADKQMPIDVSGLNGGVVAIEAGGLHTCALTTNGGVKCWGWNDYGQLGDGTTVNKNTPVDVSGLSSGMIGITVGGADYNGGHTCALTTGGAVKCWGDNEDGQLGDGTKTSKSTPVDVNGLNSNVASLVAGANYTCILTIGGSVKCWGNNDAGQLGDGTTNSKSIPVDVSGLNSGIVAIAAGGGYDGGHTCALTMNGGVKCWGANNFGQLGDGTGVNKSTPVDVSGLSSGVVAIATGGDYEGGHTCALMTTGGIKCWGNNEYGQLGDGSKIYKNTPVVVNGATSDMTAITTGDYLTCALTTSNGVKCWGDNGYGQLGDGNAWRTMPVDVMENIVPVTPTATPTFVPTAPNTPTDTPTNTPIPLTTIPTNTPLPGSTNTPTPEPTAVTVRVEGKVLDKDTQTGIPDVLMTLTGAHEAAVWASRLSSSLSTRITSGQVYTTTTALDGTFVFPAVKLGTYTLTGVKAGKLIEPSAPLMISAGGTITVTPLQAAETKSMNYLPLVTK